MQSLRAPFLFLILATLTLACQEAPTSPGASEQFLPEVPDVTAVWGTAAMVSHDCAGQAGTVLEVVTPLSQTDFWATDVELISSQCNTTPDGKGMFRVTARILSDIPLPAAAVSVDLADENGVPKVFNVILDGVLLFTGSFPCGDPSGVHNITYDCTLQTTPGGVQTVVARFSN